MNYQIIFEKVMVTLILILIIIACILLIIDAGYERKRLKRMKEGLDLLKKELKL